MAVITALGGVWPADPVSPTQWWLVVSGVDLVLCGPLLALPVHQRSTQAVLIAGVVVAAVLVSSCHTAQGVVLFALGFVVAGQFAAYALDPRRAAVVAGVVLGRDRPVRDVRARVGAPRDRGGGERDGPVLLLADGPAVRTAQGAGALRNGAPLSVVAFDIDDVEVVNDRHGHLGADDLLAEVTAAWRAELPRGAFLGRVGGDELVVVLPGADEVDARGWASSAAPRSALASSAGVATLRPDDSVRSLLDRADADLFAAEDTRRTLAGNL